MKPILSLIKKVASLFTTTAVPSPGGITVYYDGDPSPETLRHYWLQYAQVYGPNIRLEPAPPRKKQRFSRGPLFRNLSPQPIPELMELPRATKEGFDRETLKLARQILGKGSVSWLRSRPEAQQPYVKLAVQEQWRQFDPERFLRETRAQLVSTSPRGNRLYRLRRRYDEFTYNGEGDRVHYLLSYSCPSTGKLYVHYVPHNLYRRPLRSPRNPDLAMAWKLNLTLEEYDTIDAET